MKAQVVRVILMIAGKAPLNGSLDREIARAVSRGDARLVRQMLAARCEPDQESRMVLKSR